MTKAVEIYINVSVWFRHSNTQSYLYILIWNLPGKAVDSEFKVTFESRGNVTYPGFFAYYNVTSSLPGINNGVPGISGE